MSEELFDIQPTPLPPLEAARRRLLQAHCRLVEIETEGTDDLGLPTEQAEKEVREATQEVERLEREALSRENQSHAATGTSTTRPGGH